MSVAKKRTVCHYILLLATAANFVCAEYDPKIGIKGSELGKSTSPTTDIFVVDITPQLVDLFAHEANYGTCRAIRPLLLPLWEQE